MEFNTILEGLISNGYAGWVVVCVLILILSPIVSNIYKTAQQNAHELKLKEFSVQSDNIKSQSETMIELQKTVATLVQVCKTHETNFQSLTNQLDQVMLKIEQQEKSLVSTTRVVHSCKETLKQRSGLFQSIVLLLKGKISDTEFGMLKSQVESARKGFESEYSDAG